MKETLWVWSSRNQWWTTGKYTIMQEAIHRIGWRRTREIVLNDWDLDLGPHPFKVPSHRDLKLHLAPPWQPKTSEELLFMLNSDTA